MDAVKLLLIIVVGGIGSGFFLGLKKKIRGKTVESPWSNRRMVLRVAVGAKYTKAQKSHLVLCCFLTKNMCLNLQIQ